MLKTWTVIGYYEDNGQVWAHSVKDLTYSGAAKMAVLEMLEQDENMTADNIAVVEVIEGDAKCTGYTGSVAYGNDILESA